MAARENCKTTCVVARECQALPAGEKKGCIRQCISDCNADPGTYGSTIPDGSVDTAVADAAVDPSQSVVSSALVNFTGDLLSQGWGSILSNASLLSNAQSSAQSLYSALSGTSIPAGDTANYFDPSNPNYSSTFTPCDSLPDSVKKALIQAHST